MAEELPGDPRRSVLENRALSNTKPSNHAVDTGLFIAPTGELLNGSIQNPFLLFRGEFGKGGIDVSVFLHGAVFPKTVSNYHHRAHRGIFEISALRL